jgi:hypothetical protein
MQNSLFDCFGKRYSFRCVFPDPPHERNVIAERPASLQIVLYCVEELCQALRIAEEGCEHAVPVFSVGVRQCCSPFIIARPHL